MSITKKRLFGILLSFAMAMGLMLAMSATAWADEQTPIKYLEASVNESTHAVTFTEKTCNAYAEVTVSDTTWGTTGSETWYVVNGTLEDTNRITVNGTVNLILCDKATLTDREGITVSSGSNHVHVAETQSGEEVRHVIDWV